MPTSSMSGTCCCFLQPHSRCCKTHPFVVGSDTSNKRPCHAASHRCSKEYALYCLLRQSGSMLLPPCCISLPLRPQVPHCHLHSWFLCSVAAKPPTRSLADAETMGTSCLEQLLTSPVNCIQSFCCGLVAPAAHPRAAGSLL